MIRSSFKEEVIKRDDSPASQQVSKFTIGLKKVQSAPANNTPPTHKAKLESVFSAEADEVEEKPKKKLVPIDYSDEEDGARNGDTLGLKPIQDRKVSAEERKKMVQNLVNSIPSAKEEVFKYILRWEQMDSVSVCVCVCVCILRSIGKLQVLLKAGVFS